MDIHIELQDVSDVKKRLKVEIPAEIAQKEWNQVAGEYRRHARLAGFRPGKAPVALVKRHYAKSIRSEVLQKLIPESYDQAIKERGMTPVGEPSLENLTFEEGQALVYEANLEVRPKIELPDYQGISVNAEKKAVTSEDVEQKLEKLREEQARLISVDRAVVQGDYAVVDLEGEYLETEEDQSAPEPIRDENLVVKVGHDHTHESFTRALLGMKKEEEKTFEVDYPEKYPEEKLAGRKVRFMIRLTDLKERELPDLNDDFAKDLGEHETLQALREHLKVRLEKEREKNRENELRKQLVDALIGGTQFEVPSALVEDRIDTMLRDVAYRMAYQGIDPSRANVDWVRVRSDLRPEAERTVRAHLILDAIAGRERVEVSTEDLEAELKRAAESMEQPVEKVRQYFQQGERLDGLRRQVAREKVVQRLLEGARVKG